MCAIETMTFGALAFVKAIDLNLELEFPSKYRKELLNLRRDFISFKDSAERITKQEADARKSGDAMLQMQLAGLSAMLQPKFDIFKKQFETLDQKIKEREYEVPCYGKWFNCLLKPFRVWNLISAGTIILLAVEVIRLEIIVHALSN